MVKKIKERQHKAEVTGNVTALRELLEKDSSILNGVTLTRSNETPLHIAVMHGHVEFVKEILKEEPQLAGKLDSKKLSPLHLASVKGDLEIVKALLEVNSDMCFAGDRDGRKPLHLSAMKGRVEVLNLLLDERRDAAREKTKKGQTIFHLIVKTPSSSDGACVEGCGGSKPRDPFTQRIEENKLKCLKLLLDAFNDDHEFVKAKDRDGNTILHLAASGNHIEIAKHMLENTNIDMDDKNEIGDTAVQILSRTRKGKREWLEKKRDSIMVVASLIETMAFQAAVSPAGGVWQDNLTVDSQGNLVANPHRAGEAVMAYQHPKSYRYFIRANTIAFVSSLSTILLLISGLPFKRKLLMWILMMVMWLTITSIALTYGISIVVVTPKNQIDQLSRVIEVAVTVWCGVMGLLLLGNTIRFIGIWLKKTKGNDIWLRMKSRKSVDVDHGNGCPETFQICFK